MHCSFLKPLLVTLLRGTGHRTEAFGSCGTGTGRKGQLDRKEGSVLSPQAGATLSPRARQSSVAQADGMVQLGVHRM